MLVSDLSTQLYLVGSALCTKLYLVDSDRCIQQYLDGSDLCTQLNQLIQEMISTGELGAAVYHPLSHPWVA